MLNAKKILVAGSHGMIGTALVTRLRALGHDVVPLVRTPTKGQKEVGWSTEPNASAIDLDGINGFDAVINVGGVSISEKRWTPVQKQRLWNSRIIGAEILTKALKQIEEPPKVFISASAIGYYGNRGDEVLNEQAAPGQGFLAELCQKWEEVTRPAEEANIRVVNIRTGIVLSYGQGALKEQGPLFKLGLGGRLGSGNQYMSWISLRDEVEAIVHILEHDALSGPINLTSPHPVKNVDYTEAFGLAVRRPAKIPAPRWMMALPLGGELTDEVLLASQRVIPEKLRANSFRFQDTDLLATFRRIFNPEKYS